MSYETFDHTADIGIRAWGGQLHEVFEEMAKALFSVLADLETVDCKKTITVKVSAPSIEDLMLNWLKELLFIFETKRLVFSDFHVIQVTAAKLAAEARGEPLDPKKHILGREVKAVTLHQFKLEQRDSGYLAEAILDI